ERTRRPPAPPTRRRRCAWSRSRRCPSCGSAPAWRASWRASAAGRRAAPCPGERLPDRRARAARGRGGAAPPPGPRGRRVAAVWQDAQPRFLDLHLAVGRTVQAVGRRGKFLLCPLDGGLELVMHLGMTGGFRFAPLDAAPPPGPPPLDPYVRARLALDDGRELLFR